MGFGNEGRIVEGGSDVSEGLSPSVYHVLGLGTVVDALHLNFKLL